MIRSCIHLVEKNIRGAWVIYGDLGVRQYYGYSKKAAQAMYREACRSTIICERRGHS